jgi:adenylosuccinate lyase
MQDALVVKGLEKALMQRASSGSGGAAAAAAEAELRAIDLAFRPRLYSKPDLQKCAHMFFFGVCADDVNSLAVALALKDLLKEEIVPQMNKVVNAAALLADKYASNVLRVRGPSSTKALGLSTLGKEFANYAYRLARQRKHVEEAPILARFSGHGGNHVALSAAYPGVQW